MRKRPIKTRFEEKFSISPGCWNWTAGLGNSGYGHFWANGKPVPAHRTSYELYVGGIPDGMCILHKCDNRLCVNPDHLSVGTIAENTEDMVKKGRQAIGESVFTSKLTAAQISAIRNDPRSQRKIAADYGVSHTSIGYVKSGKLWGHVS